MRRCVGRGSPGPPPGSRRAPAVRRGSGRPASRSSATGAASRPGVRSSVARLSSCTRQTSPRKASGALARTVGSRPYGESSSTVRAVQCAGPTRISVSPRQRTAPVANGSPPAAAAPNAAGPVNRSPTSRASASSEPAPKWRGKSAGRKRARQAARAPAIPADHRSNAVRAGPDRYLRSSWTYHSAVPGSAVGGSPRRGRPPSGPRTSGPANSRPQSVRSARACSGVARTYMSSWQDPGPSRSMRWKVRGSSPPGSRSLNCAATAAWSG